MRSFNSEKNVSISPCASSPSRGRLMVVKLRFPPLAGRLAAGVVAVFHHAGAAAQIGDFAVVIAGPVIWQV